MMMTRIAPDNCPVPVGRKTRSIVYREDKEIGEMGRLLIEEPVIRGRDLVIFVCLNSRDDHFLVSSPRKIAFV